MNDTIPGPGDLGPGDLGMLPTRGLGYAANGLTHDLDVADYGVLGLGVGKEGLTPSGGVLNNTIDRLQNIGEVKPGSGIRA